MRYLLFFSVVVSVLFLSRCANNKADEMVPIDDTSCIQNGQIITYNSDIKTILETYCTNPDFGSCHQPIQDGGSGFDYTKYDGIKNEVDNGQLEFRVFTIGDMPSPATLGPNELEPCDALKLQTWIDQGAPEN